MPMGSIVYSDNGASMKCARDSAVHIVTEVVGPDRAIGGFFPAIVHQFLSPNDKSLHGVAKATLRSCKFDRSNALKFVLEGLRVMNDVEGRTIRGFFRGPEAECTEEAAYLLMFHSTTAPLGCWVSRKPGMMPIWRR